MSKNKDLTYEDALGQLQKIVKDLENRDIKIDDLASKVSQAKSLVDFCREKLSQTEDEINKIIRPASNDEIFE